MRSKMLETTLPTKKWTPIENFVIGDKSRSPRNVPRNEKKDIPHGEKGYNIVRREKRHHT